MWKWECLFLTPKYWQRSPDMTTMTAFTHASRDRSVSGWWGAENPGDKENMVPGNMQYPIQQSCSDVSRCSLKLKTAFIFALTLLLMEEYFLKPFQVQKQPEERELSCLGVEKLESTRTAFPISVSSTLGVPRPNPLMSPFGQIPCLLGQSDLRKTLASSNY